MIILCLIYVNGRYCGMVAYSNPVISSLVILYDMILCTKFQNIMFNQSRVTDYSI